MIPLRALCIHAHFYQPPREDPLSGFIPAESGAAPFRNWNERIHTECYRPNVELGNFERISFNIGPTLIDWMISYDPDTYHKLIAQDAANVSRYGVGNAMAQAYNHTILPLANHADKVTQIYWGIVDFQHRFGRKPQGMWLPETAVDLETLNILAEQGIEFTILAPWQANTDNLDPTEPYRVMLPEGKSITVFFYQRELSGGISFNPGLTNNADDFAKQEIFQYYSLEKAYQGEPQFLMIASDGELYGHHQHFRDRFLARLMDGASARLGITATYPALWLHSIQPRRTISIREMTSWSCYHGVDRWMRECECTPGDGRWKAHLRQAFNKLAASLDLLYANELSAKGVDPWRLRNEYIRVMLGERSLPDLVGQMAKHRLAGEELWRIRLLLESQRERQRMFTSCGFYFDDFSRIEPKNNVTYAAHAAHLSRLATGVDLAPQTCALLEHVRSNYTNIRGDMVFRRQLERVEGLEPVVFETA